MNNKKFEQIIIGGLQRSGTSLVRAMVGSHPEISIYQWDLEIFEKIYPAYGKKGLDKSKSIELVNEILGHRKVVACDIKFDQTYFLNWIEDAEETIYFSDIYIMFFQYYLDRTGRKYVGLKTPFNEFFSDVIFDLFPKTKFIHVIRNPLDAAVSLKAARKSWWGLNIDFDEHFRDWEKSANLALSNSEKYKGKYFILKYEDLISDPTAMAKNIAKFLNVDFHYEMVKLNGQPGWTGTNSSFETIDPAIFKTSAIGRYKHSLNKDVQRKYFFRLKELLKRFDYEVPDKAYLKSKSLYIVYQFPYWTKNQSRKIYNSISDFTHRVILKSKIAGLKIKRTLLG